jgi:tetratricopeptide (TPR) repeat protein
VVAAALGYDDEVVEARCTALAHQGQFLQAHGRAEWPDGTVSTQYGFLHALYQEVLYQRVPTARQTRWHARIGTRLAHGFGEHAGEMAAAVAMHLLRGRMLPQAVPYLRQAGEMAMARSAYREAVGYFEQALGVLPHLPETRGTREQAIDLRLALRSALWPSGDSGRVLAVLREAEALAVALDDPRRLGQVLLYLSNYFYRRGNAYEQAMASARRALSLAMADGDVVLQALANRYLGFVYEAQGDYRRSIDCLRQTVTSLDGARRRERFGRVFLPAVLSHVWLAACHAELGAFREGKVLGDEGLRIAEAVAHPGSLMTALWGVGLLALRQGDLPRALPPLKRAVSLCQEADLLLYFPWVAGALGAAYSLGGHVADAISLLTQALEQSIATESVYFQALCQLPLGAAQLLAGRLEEAQTLAERVLALTREHGERGHEAYALHLLGEIAARHTPSRHEKAEGDYRQAHTLAEELGMRPLTAHCHLGLGNLYADIGRRTEACAELSAAIDLYHPMDMTFWIPQAEAALAQVAK